MSSDELKHGLDGHQLTLDILQVCQVEVGVAESGALRSEV